MKEEVVLRWSETKIWLPLLLMGALVVISYRARRWPSADNCIELIAYGAGVYGAYWLWHRGATEPTDGAWILMGAACAVAVVSARGIFKVLNAIHALAAPRGNQTVDAGGAVGSTDGTDTKTTDQS
jgi:hypothetical protein